MNPDEVAILRRQPQRTRSGMERTGIEPVTSGLQS